MSRVFGSAVLPLVVYVVLAAVPAAAQDREQAAPAGQAAQTTQQQGPLVLEPIHSGLVVSPDVKMTRVNGTTRTLIGAYGGWLLEDALLLGGGGYWLADRSRDLGMAYAGFVVGWTMPAASRVRFGARALVGGGQATIGRDVTLTLPFDSGRDGFFHHDQDAAGTNAQPATFTGNARFHQGFFIAEPQAELVLQVKGWMAIDVAAGYRAIAAARGFDQQLRGPVGSLGVRFGV